MCRKRSAIDAAPGGTMSPLDRSGCFTFGLAARRHLFDVFEPKQQLVLGQCLGAAAEAMTLQLLDDLFQPLGTSSFGQQHRLQRTGIVGKSIDRHVAIRSWSAVRREWRIVAGPDVQDVSPAPSGPALP